MFAEQIQVGVKIASTRGSGVYKIKDLDQHPVWPHLTIALLIEVGSGKIKTIFVEDANLVNYELLN